MGSRDLGLVTIFFVNPRTHRSLRERPFPPLPLARFASKLSRRTGIRTPDARFASLELELPPNFPRNDDNDDTTPIIDLRACTLQLCFRDKDMPNPTPT